MSRTKAVFDEIAACLKVFSPHAILLDTYHKDKLGGSGETFNWELAMEAKERFGLPLILAGGLTPENVGEAVRTVRPYAVDVSSGVEAEPGRKDHAKVKAFIQAVREADRGLSNCDLQKQMITIIWSRQRGSNHHSPSINRPNYSSENGITLPDRPD